MRRAPSRMFRWILSTLLMILKLFSRSTICKEAYSEPSQTSGAELSTNKVDLNLSFILAEGSIWNVWMGSEYASDVIAHVSNFVTHASKPVLFLLVYVNWLTVQVLFLYAFENSKWGWSMLMGKYIPGLRYTYSMLRYWRKIFFINWKTRQEVSSKVSFPSCECGKRRHVNYFLDLKVH